MLILDSKGHERYRIEGYLPKSEFRAHLEMGLARVAFMHKQWAEAERRYDQIVQNYPDASVVPEAIYWRGVCRYKGSNDHTALGEVATTLTQQYQDSVWAAKASVWSE